MRRLIALAMALIPAVQALIYRDRLPELVASNFNGDGQVNSYTERDALLMVMIVIGLSAFMLQLAIGWMLRRLDPSLINIPNREHWLSPAQKEATIDRVESRMLVFHIGLMTFLAIVNYLVLDANLMPEPRLSGWFAIALVVFAILTIVWLVWFIRSFRVPSGDSSHDAPPASPLGPE